MKRLLLVLLAAAVLLPAAILGIQILHDPGSDRPVTIVADQADQIIRGQYLARAADCMACHTTRGGAQYAGGRVIPTPFGNLVSPNITSDKAHGIGAWSADDFWRALHNGKSRDGRFLYPAFPYTSYTKMTRADSDALFAWFRTVPPVAQPNQPHALRFPYDQRLLLAGWRALYFRPGEFAADAAKSASWNRGAYLVQGAGHCSACHAARNALGATDSGIDLAGGMIPVLGWYAPSLTSDTEAGLGAWDTEQIVSLLKTGVSPRATVFGPMAEVVAESLQHLSDADVNAMAEYLKSLPPTASERADAAARTSPKATPGDRPGEDLMARGAKLYGDHCMDCHAKDGSGRAPAYPPLAGNRAITMRSAVNPIRIVLNGGYPPGTAGDPRPYGMPPFGPFMSDDEIAAVVSYTRAAWGNAAAPISSEEVSRYRAVPVD
jgi:mono/diheme cytochrome c family protein